ncbi:uncharacterized protein OCT59_026830 [Rhizophagus irregularis]|uniref:HTH myb-type domain-containing protein n=3 Tax=Rhizophagus irregularis TaxID=588596 RepID=A0A2N1NXQ5_9GLOM|nr:hypothetical protein GLOIN_2v1792091 [Rhizophagus irregularis DAOM 181602=DAOM 197198]EXX59700.1 hypothetical protein RirG_186720 [Rhizophagus irregularis DAOM 197198w]PKK78689.1 hypothetical protein RhiirC2_843253 [Rhizophagus irregularis]POG54458.1 hypothetical protein GLOIN_2v1792091 [Rhizophagus irregularis DAOM 181602=DAOM 197198]UZO06511.1 hypothetical protein OCT59_026830 [Rhizophagus irregularis]GBC16244.2 hypothetical protein GLOIN_2v1792091 [Rhizophagus irregularis DAOM 181602=DAO|eukprot:XP_025164223.1 hypothetical protein GLOIN_2v1792091 [Rhizophagus irregularis DAOM 181602=DAOM 197198]
MDCQPKKLNRFDKESEDTILKYMNEWIDSGKPNRKPFAILSTRIPYTPKQISHYWANKLNPRLCLNKNIPFSNDEKEFIFKWVKQHLKTSNKKVPWKTLQTKILEDFGKLRAQNDIKNLWNIHKKKLDRWVKKSLSKDKKEK